MTWQDSDMNDPIKIKYSAKKQIFSIFLPLWNVYEVVSSYENIEQTAVGPRGKRGLDLTYIRDGDEVIPDMRRDVPVGYVEETV